MAEVSFYHLVRDPLETALPKLLEKARERDFRILVRAASAERVAHLDGVLWTYSRESFLAHGRAGQARAAEQPILLCDSGGNPNAANLLVVVDGAETDDAGAFERCLYLFDGKSEEGVAEARARWRGFREAGIAVTYWQQGERGWEKKT
ncbi:DNA polymerase III subunit chi [Oceanibacterium hippocampi]|uniref:DNA polymerase III subunit chi n=1 Tax=Oceanibacterium hippocampi TaxID=745714 RepID=A0A1Y5SUJ9_9PROT|nr:DNA polymerase III subunit chi [Oceanibacterium hippocampi]SLN48423.1 DNA polymerase III subunit chi [Oceanibacterium hippocampi]